jgi:ATP-dependent DNA ligase
MTSNVSKQFALEGVMAKRLDSRHEPGRRSPNWLKAEEHPAPGFVVGGCGRVRGRPTGSIGSSSSASDDAGRADRSTPAEGFPAEERAGGRRTAGKVGERAVGRADRELARN